MNVDVEIRMLILACFMNNNNKLQQINFKLSPKCDKF